VGDLPALSPDGRQVAYVRGDELRLIGTDGQGDQLLAGGLAISLQPAWSPDGALIALISDGALSLIGADGKGLRRITQLAAHGAPAWSPDGTRLAFSADGVYVTDLAGAAPRKVADGVAPVWSPDGTTIAYLKSDTSAAPELWLVPADGGAPRMLWSCQAGPRVLGDCRLDDARWAGDGRLISLVGSGIVAGKALFREVVALNADSGAEVFSSDWQVLSSEGQGSAPRWVSGSDRLAYIHPEHFALYTIGTYLFGEEYQKICVVSLPAAGCAGIPAGHGDVLSYDVGQ
jgi:Tol biopolymer transport system component